MRIRKRQPIVFLVVVAVLLAAFFYLFVFTPYKNIRTKASVLVASAKDLKDTFSKNDIDLLNNKMDDFSKKYTDFEQAAKSIYWAAFVPYVSDFKNGVEAGRYLISAGQESITAITPYADLIGFKKGTSSFLEKSSEDRLQTAILTLDKVLGKVDVISENINQAQIRIDRIDPKRYPQKIGSTEVQSKVVALKDEFDGLASLFVNAKPLVKRLPEIFGKDREKNYLILFQNDKELRATGGFLTAYATFQIRQGKMKIVKSGDIYTLDNSIPSHPASPREISTYHLNVPNFNIRDSNLSPDFPTSIDLFNSLYKKSSERFNYDGVFTVDSKVLIDMLTIFGDTEADGVRFSAKIDRRCDCAQVLYQLFDMVDRPTPYLRENRKGILGDLMYALFYKAIGFSPSRYWGKLAQQMFVDLKEKHILLYFTDTGLENAVAKLNYAGKIVETKSDYLHINDVNFAGAKSNLFVSESVESKTISEGNTIRRELTINYRNPYPASDCNLERGGLCLNAPFRDWIRIYVPQGSKLSEFRGSLKKVETYDELGKTVFEGFLIVYPQGTAQVKVTYTLPPSIGSSNYSLLVQKQPGTDRNKMKVMKEGRILFDEMLEADRVIR